MTVSTERTITETVLVDWIPDPTLDPRRCVECGHLHFARTPRAVPGPQAAKVALFEAALQWMWCEDEDCRCRILVPV